MRSILPIVSDRGRSLFGPAALQAQGNVGVLGGAVSRFGKSFTGEPEAITREIQQDHAAEEADTLLVTIPNTLGVRENLCILGNTAEHLAPTIHSLRAG
ncbi:hypothetical protein ACUJ8N_24815 [Streptomyces sp. ESR1.13]|uniref:hypothetical protein n=1 Tax=unclassified Streptomyces TaxID=2593676 RepID=UPI004042190B